MKIKELNNSGNTIMFKSAINHKVTPVTKGERRTLAIFLYGPAFK
jgi:predicted 2-oxoglutarate/Fe(II)-dependent dioxygenase YbiX